MLLRKALCSLAILAMCVGFVMAEEIKGRITKIDAKTVTVVTGKKDDKKTTEYDIAKDCKFCKTENKDKVELEGGVKNEAFKSIDSKKGLPAMINVTDGKVTEIVLVPGKKAS